MRAKNGRERGQAMTEFVIMLPFFIALLAGLIQFTRTMTDLIKLGMVEREAMMYCSTADSTSGIEKFTKDYGEALGMDRNAISVDKSTADKLVDWLGWFGTILKWIGFTYAVDILWGNDLVIHYESPLIGPFRTMMGKDSITLTAKLHTGVGWVFNMDLNPIHIVENIVHELVKAASWVIDAIIDFFKKKG